jgi:DNA mismatch repair protein MSH3
MLRDQAYVPFDIDFSEGDGRAKVITGPNMAGTLRSISREVLRG